ncbi:MAG TPA: hypothetical protein VH063_10190 [Gaiellaceae bacterium]|jgi:hypothetical protein|nr:hypothetical protein [Gaiellaceae bacterium]
MSSGESSSVGEIDKTFVVAWDVNDPAKAGDPRYFWTEDDATRMRDTIAPVTAGAPRGASLLRLERDYPVDRQDGDPDAPEERFGARAHHGVRIAIEHFHAADPETTFLIVSHMTRPTSLTPTPLSPEVERIREELVAATEAGEEDSAEGLRARLRAELTTSGFRPRSELFAADENRATEVAPGVFVQDERPTRA